ncbi:MAG: molecular chaperone DnaJ [Gaiellaceae bacterium]
MSYADLARLGVSFRPIDQWPGDLSRSRRYAPFRSSMSTTVRELERELRMLSAKQIVLQIAMDDRDIRLDGFPRANARAQHPGVILAFESKHGPLKFAVDTFTDWTDNLRAIALGMEALRKVDRYGVTKRGEQYTGWRALPSGSENEYGIPSARVAREYLDERYGGDLKRALMATHPDRGGDLEEFHKVMRIKELVGG